MSLFSVLPPPRFNNVHNTSDVENKSNNKRKNKPTKTIPPYTQRENSDWIPKNLEDFNDGGAYPEIHLSQYPLNMGRNTETTNNPNILSLQLDKYGNTSFDQIVKHGKRKGAIIYSKFSDMIEADIEDENELQKPSEEETLKNLMETKQALETKLDVKINASHRGGAIHQAHHAANQQEKRQIFRYKPTNGTEDDVKYIQIEEAPKDSLEPPKFHIKKIPPTPHSPPPPVMHSPERNLTKVDQENFYIPPCISNYVNRKGHIIPLDKRISADGSGLKTATINPKFATVSEALYIAENNSRLEIKERAELQKKLLEMEHEREQEHIRNLAQKARELKSKINKDDIKEKEERARMRGDKRREDNEREISEKITLGQPQKTNYEGDVEYDSRLLGRESGLDDGFGADDGYNLYDKPLFGESSLTQVYKPSKERIKMFQDLDNDTDMNQKFEKDTQQKRQPGPVYFEREVTKETEKNNNEDDDPFGLNKFMTQPNKRKTFDHIGKSGFMRATAGSGSTSREEDNSGKKRKKIEFTSNSSKQ
ncbi:hypothetical protein ABK040_013808 [Willaertia magna]